jgi:MFS family permease
MRLFPLFIFWCLWYLNFSNRTVFSPILPLIEDSLSLSHGATGGLFTSLSMGYGLTMLISGRFASVWGYKRTVVFGLICTSLSLFCLQWAGSYGTFHILFFFLGTGLGTYIPSILPILTETYEPRQWGKAIGLHDSAASVSILSIPVLVALGLPYLSWRRLLLFPALASLLFLIPFWRVAVEPQKKLSHKKSPFMDLLRKRPVWVISFLWIFAAASNLGVYTILPLFLIKEKGIDFHSANTLLGISRIGGIVAPISMGFLVDRYGYQAMLRWSIVTTGLSTVGLSLASGLFQMTVALVFQATLALSFFPVGLAAISKLTDLSERSLATGIALSLGVAFGMGGAPFIIGMIADHLSFQIGIFGLGVLTLLSSWGVRLLEKQ